MVCFGSGKLSILASVGAGAAYSRSSRFLCWHHLSVLCEGWSTRARSLPVMCSRKSCVKCMNKPDSPLHPPCRHLGPGPPLPPPLFFFGHGFTHRSPRRQLRHTREQELLSASQDDRVTLRRHRGCANVWLGMRDGAVEDTGSGPGAVVLRKVALRSERAAHKLRQNLLLHLRVWG